MPEDEEGSPWLGALSDHRIERIERREAPLSISATVTKRALELATLR